MYPVRGEGGSAVGKNFKHADSLDECLHTCQVPLTQAQVLTGWLSKERTNLFPFLWSSVKYVCRKEAE